MEELDLEMETIKLLAAEMQEYYSDLIKESK